MLIAITATMAARRFQCRNRNASTSTIAFRVTDLEDMRFRDSISAHATRDPLSLADNANRRKTGYSWLRKSVPDEAENRAAQKPARGLAVQQNRMKPIALNDVREQTAAACFVRLN